MISGEPLRGAQYTFLIVGPVSITEVISMLPEEELATIGDLRSPLIWIAALAKALVKKGVLSQDDIINELRHYGTLSNDTDAELRIMIETVRKW